MIGRFVDWFFAVGGLLGLAAAGFWAVHAGPNSAANLEQKLQIAAEAALAVPEHDWATVTIDGQHATITGLSPTYDSVEATIEALREIGGGSVLWNITKITSETASAPPISPYVWSAMRAPNGDIKLAGHVPSAEILRELAAKADGLTGGEVINEMQVGSGEPLGPWKDVALRGLVQLALMDVGEVTLTDSKLSLSGTATQNGARGQILTALEALKLPYRSEADIQGANLWSARHERGALILSGQVETEDQKDTLLALAEENYGGEVRDEMTVGPGEFEGWQTTVLAALPHFASFETGLLGFSPRGGGFTVRGSGSGSAVNYLREDTAGSAYAVNVDVNIVEPELTELLDLDVALGEPGACQAGFDAIMAGNIVTFESSEATITRESGETLDKIMAMARLCPDVSIEVQGHTDSGGQREFNVSLSKWRAAAVVDYMKAGGISPARLTSEGFGPDQPVADNATRAGRAANRRIEFSITEEG